MSLLEQITSFKKSQLKTVDTKVTRLDGNISLETRDELGSCTEINVGISSVGFVIDTKPDFEVACVIQRSLRSGQLSFGSQDVAHNQELRKAHDITHILCLIPSEIKYLEKSEQIYYKQISILDLPDFSIRNCFEDCFEFINFGLNSKGHVFVHCNAGVSRSAAVVIAYLMKFCYMSYLEAVTLIRQVRPVAKPNNGFDKQLRLYENELKSERMIQESCDENYRVIKMDADLFYPLQDEEVQASKGFPIYCDSRAVDLLKSCQNNLNTSLPFKASIFPFFSPSFYFSNIDEIVDVDGLPECVRKVMIWQLTSTTPRILKRILVRSGFKFTKKLNNWIGTWTKNIRAYEFQNLAIYQKFNHFPGTFQIGRKDRLWRTISRMQQLHSKEEFNFVPDTIIFPNEINKLFSLWENEKESCNWIVKPCASARGKGVYIIHKRDQLPKQGSFVIQRYISKPFLINNTKFDLRIYVYVTSFNPLRIYVYEDGLVRFASVKYSIAENSLNNSFVHLTNCTINKNNVSYTISKDSDSCDGHKWRFKAFWKHLESLGINKSVIWEKIIDIIIKTIISCESSVRILSQGNIIGDSSCHEIFGFDIILDENLKPWLLEVNISPSLESSTLLDKTLKGAMLAELLNLAGFKLPSHLPEIGRKYLAETLGIHPSSVCFATNANQTSLLPEESAKQVKFLTFERHLYVEKILENLNAKDILQLVRYEDEISRTKNFQRIFPSCISSRYHKYFNRPQYYTNLLDSWEHRFHNQREKGRQYLCKLVDVHNYNFFNH